MKRERLKNKEKAKRRQVSLTDTDYDVAKAIGKGNASHGIKTALRIAIKLNEAAIEVL